jgi:hypothetical protein
MVTGVSLGADDTVPQLREPAVSMTFTVCLAVHVTRVFVLLMVNESVAVPVPEPLVPSTTWLAVDVNMASNEPVRPVRVAAVNC